MSQETAGKRHWLVAVKLTATILLVGFLLSKADWAQVGASFSRANPWLLVLVLFCMVMCVVISAWKWQKLLQIHRINIPFQRLNRLYFIAMFFNNFLPTGIGGDGYRVMKTWRNERSRAGALLAVFMERVSGILALLMLGFIGGIIGWAISDDRISRWLVQLCLIGGFGALALIVLVVFTGLYRKLKERVKLPGKLRTLAEHAEDYRRNPVLVRDVVGISFGFHFFTAFWWWALLTAVGTGMPVYHLIVVLALLSIVTVIPLSINGIGLVDGSFIYLAGQYGVSYDQALTVMLIQRALMIPISLYGAWLYLKQREERRD